MKIMHKRKSAFSEIDFKQVKVLVDAGIKNREIARILNMSPASVGNLSHQPTWEGYVLRKKELAEELKKKQASFSFKEPNLGKAETTATSLVLNKELSQFEIKLLNILTEIEQDLDNLNQNITSKQVDTTKKRFW